jgi:hypothetical protein
MERRPVPREGSVSKPTWYPDPERPGFERAIEWVQGYDDQPYGPKSYGQHGMDLRFLLRGPKGVTQFLVSTGWVPGKKGVPASLADYFPSATDIGYHAMTPQWEGQEEYGRECEYLGGRTCYYDGSGLSAEPILDAFIRRGDAAVWTALHEWHDGLKGGAS